MTVAEAVVALALVALNDQAALDQRLVLVLLERRLEPLPSLGRVADAEARRDLSGEAAALEVLDGARRFLQLGAVELHRLLHHAVQVGLALLARRLFRRARLQFGHLHADRRGQVLDGVDVAHPGVGHHEADGIAVHAAAEAVIELLGRADRERGRLLAMERAQPHEIGAALLQLDVALHHVHDIDPVEEILLERLGDHAPILTENSSRRAGFLRDRIPCPCRPCRRAAA